jgi:hypothetical protein
MAKRTKLILIAVPILLAIALVGLGVMFAGSGPDPAQFMYLKQPQMRTMADQRVLVVETKGDPTAAGGEAFGLLFKTYFKLKGVPKGRKQPAPRARWPLALDTPKDQWIGRYAMPIPDGVDALPGSAQSTSGLRAELARWEYGPVAEILHAGPYSREEPTIRRLTDFIREGGYVIKGEHEEEYIKGPGMFFKGNPEKYLTIIRYRIKKPSPSTTD